MKLSMAKCLRSPVVFVAMALLAACSASAPNYSAVLTNSDRPADERALDAARKPNEVMAFYGVKSGDKVADLWAGRGYYTAILSEIVGPTGIVYTQNPSSRDEINQRWKGAKFANVRVTDGAFDKLTLPQDGSLDFVLIHLNYHDVAIETRPLMNKRVLAALKRGGIYGVVDHSAKDGSGNEAVKTLHRIEESTLRREIEAAGFKLIAEADFLRNPGDTRDAIVFRPQVPVDEFVLKFVKPAPNRAAESNVM